jgi:hypothetical protein
MGTKATRSTLLPLSAAIAIVAVALPAPVFADPNDLPYGPDTCIQGYVWREARTGDTVCVTPPVRDRTAQENANPSLNKEPNSGAYGPNTCKQGFVWREAFDGDTICVTPEMRGQTLADNAAAASRKQANQPQTPSAQSTITLEVVGSGDVYAIWSDPFGQVAGDHTKLPFSKSYPLRPTRITCR